MGGQPAMLTMGLFLITSRTPTAPVGLGRAACTLPQCAQAPRARIAAAPDAASSSTVFAVRPPITVYMPSSFNGTDPVTTSRYLPLFALMAACLAFSTAAPAPAISVWL